MKAVCLFLLLCVIAGATATPATAQQVIGAVGAANANATARAPGHMSRALKPGADIYFKDHVVTKKGGSAQLTFLDRSTLNVSENSDVIIDDFVYRPGTKGTLNASLSRGMMRFVGGEISHGGSATLQTPTVTIGIRGGIAIVGFLKDAANISAIPGLPSNFHGGTIIINGFGKLSVANSTGTVDVSRPGYALFVGAPTEGIGPPIRLAPAATQAIMRSLTSESTQHGGASAKAIATASALLDTQRAAHLVEPKIDSPSRPSIDALDFTSTFARGDGLARNRSQSKLAGHLQQLLTNPVSSRGSKSETVSLPNGAKLISGNVEGQQQAASSGPLPAQGSTLSVHDIHAASVIATTIYAHNINAAFVIGNVHIVKGSSNVKGGNSSTLTVSASIIYAHDIHATTVSALDIYVDEIHGL